MPHAYVGSGAARQPRSSWLSPERRVVNDFDAQMIEHFRTNGGIDDILLLHTVGARTGVERVTPLRYHLDGDRMVVAASKSGAPTHPDWFHNLVAHPEARVEVGREMIAVVAVVADGEERERLWARHKELTPVFGEFEARTSRQIPVLVLERVDV